MLFLQKKKESLRKGNKAMAAVFGVILLALTVAGYGKIKEPIPLDLSSGNMEDVSDEDAKVDTLRIYRTAWQSIVKETGRTTGVSSRTVL